MKTLVIPVGNENEINISEIDDYFCGLIIGYLGTKPIGYISYYDHDWYFRNDIDDDDYVYEDDHLLLLIKYLVSNKICDNFKVIEFHES